MAEINLTQVERVLVIRRDNIGDLLCTTPLLSALRRALPQATLTVFANSYNAPVLAGNPDIDQVVAYTKSKHGGGSRLAGWGRQIMVYGRLRAAGYDLLIQANPSSHSRNERLARIIGARWRLGVTELGRGGYTLPLRPDEVRGTHHVERVFSLLASLGIEGQPGPLTLRPPHWEGPWPESPGDGVRIGVHLSSRKEKNRWPMAHYRQLVDALLAQGGRVYLFWSPGSETNALHPGDDEKAVALAKAFPGRVTLVPTLTLPALIAGMARMERMVVPDGGALHCAAGLGKPLVALFGCTDPTVWGPWGVPCRVLNGHGEAGNITPEAVLTGLAAL